MTSTNDKIGNAATTAMLARMRGANNQQASEISDLTTSFFTPASERTFGQQTDVANGGSLLELLGKFVK